MYNCNFPLREHKILDSFENKKAQFAIQFYAAKDSENFNKHLENMIRLQLDPSYITRNTAIDFCHFMKDVLNINDITLSQTTHRNTVEVLREAGINVNYDETQLGHFANETEFAEHDNFSEATYNIVKFDNGDDYEIIEKDEFTPQINRNIQQQNEPINEQEDMADDNEQFDDQFDEPPFDEGGDIVDEQPSKWSRLVRSLKCSFMAQKLPIETRRRIKEEKLAQIEAEYQLRQAMQDNDEYSNEFNTEDPDMLDEQ